MQLSASGYTLLLSGVSLWLDLCVAENYIFSVSPQEGVPALLATPGWPDIKVQMLGSREEIFSRREDEEVESKLSVPKSFHLNVSNCHPDHGRFSILSQVVLQKTPGSFLSIIVGVVGALLLLALTALAVICVVTRKRKRQISHQVSIYNPNGNAFFPGHSLFPKSRADNESHVYATIDDTMVYGHLLQDLEYSGPGCCGELQKDTSQTLTGFHPKDSAFIKEMPLDAPEVDVYRPFVPLLPPPMRMRGGDDSHGPAVQSVVDNELHTLTKDKDVLEPECEETK
ncbi:CUB domain-containing protein 1-like [Arapaima gigas]